MADKLLKEDGDKILQEDGSFILLTVDPIGEENGDSWWAGVQSSFVCVPLAIAALTLSGTVAAANTFIHTDDVPLQIPAEAPQDASSGQRARHTPVFQRWAFTDEWMPSVVDDTPWQPPPVVRPLPIDSRVWAVEDELPTRIDEEYWWTASPASLVSPLPSVLQSLSLTEDDWVPPPVAFAPEEDYDWAALVSPGRGAARTPTWGDGDELPVVAPIEEDAWPIPPTRASTVPLALSDGDDFVPPPVVVEEDWLVLLPQPPTLWTRAFTADDDIVPQPAPVPAEASGLFRQRAQQAPIFHRWASTEDLPPQGAAPPITDEDYWFTYGAVTPPPISTPWTFHQDECPQPVADDGASYQVLVIGDAPLGRVFSDDDWVPPASPVESDWQVWTPPLLAARPLYAPDLDELLVPVPVFPPVEEDWQVWTPPLVAARPLLLPDPDQDIVPVAVVEEDWSVWTPPGIVPRPLYAPDLDEALAPPVVVTLDEDGWAGWVPVLLAVRPIYLPDPDPDTVPSVISEEDWSVWTPARVPAQPLLLWIDGDAIFPAVVVEAEWDVWTPGLVPARPLYAPDLDEVIVPFVPVVAIVLETIIRVGMGSVYVTPGGTAPLGE